MIAVRPAAARGTTRIDAAAVHHAFSCGDYYDPAHMGFGPVRAINEIVLAPGAGLERERRANVDILDWVVEGRVRRECGGTDCLLESGSAHLIGAGSGIDESIRNASPRQPARVLQVWLQSERLNAAPCHAHCATPADDGRLVPMDGRGDASPLRRDVEVVVLRLAAGMRRQQACRGADRVWLQVTRGCVEVNGVRLLAGDAAMVLNETCLGLVAAGTEAELMWIGLRAD